MANPWEMNWAPASSEAPSSSAETPPWEMDWSAPQDPRTPKTSTSEAVLEGALTGAGAGWRDEVYGASKASGLPEWMGGFRAPFGAARLAAEHFSREPGEATKTYDEAVARIRERQRNAAEDHPIAYNASQIGGSFLPASKIVKGVGTGATLAGAVVRSAAAGGIIGGITGAGDANGDLTDRAIGAAEGAPVGVVLGGAAPVVGHAVGKGISAVMNREGTAGTAAGKVLNALERDGVTPANLQSRLDAIGPQAMIADVGPNAMQQAAVIAASPGAGQQTIRAAIEARNAGASGRVTNAVNGVMGGPVNYGQIESSIIQRRSNAARPLYDQAYQIPLPPIPEVQEVLNTPTGRAAAARAARLSRDEGIPFDPNSVRGVDLIKRTLDDVVSMGQRTGRNNEARIIANLRDRLVSAVDNQVPEYAMARDAYAGESAIRDALQAGRNLFSDSLSPQQIGDQLVGMTAGERDAFLQGARAQIQTIMGTARNDSSRVRQLLQKGFNQEKLEMVLGPQAANDLMRQVGFETTAANTSHRVIGNSETAARVAGREDLTPGSSGLGIRDSFAAGGMMGAARGVGLKLMDRAIEAVQTGRQRAIEGAMADILTLQGPDRQRAIDAVIRAAQQRDRSGTLARQVRNLASGAALSGSAPYDRPVGAAALDLIGAQ
ncbi:hypothetical protein [Bradyrhizobium manausense]|nr:hypothetical protein [Bradyrhizobium manausense]